MNKTIMLFITLIIGVNCSMGKSTEHLENFDDLFAGNPVDIEKNMKALLPKAEKEDNSIYVQILSQIAVAQAMQSKIVEANQTLSKAKKVVKKSDILAQTRIVLSEGEDFTSTK